MSSIYIEIGSYAIRLYPRDILYITVLLKKIDMTVCSVHLIHKNGTTLVHSIISIEYFSLLY